MRQWGLLAAAVGCEVAGSLGLKAALERPWLGVLVAVAYVAAFVLLGQVLKAGMPLGVAYGFWAAAGVALTAVLSSLLYAEPFTALMGAGLVLIVAGVLTVELGSHVAPDAVGGRAVR
jgi:small multidrug resistance pump